jgi:hypothetical protein
LRSSVPAAVFAVVVTKRPARRATIGTSSDHPRRRLVRRRRPSQARRNAPDHETAPDVYSTTPPTCRRAPA